MKDEPVGRPPETLQSTPLGQNPTIETPTLAEKIPLYLVLEGIENFSDPFAAEKTLNPIFSCSKKEFRARIVTN